MGVRCNDWCGPLVNHSVARGDRRLPDRTSSRTRRLRSGHRPALVMGNDLRDVQCRLELGGESDGLGTTERRLIAAGRATVGGA